MCRFHLQRLLVPLPLLAVWQPLLLRPGAWLGELPEPALLRDELDVLWHVQSCDLSEPVIGRRSEPIIRK